MTMIDSKAEAMINFEAERQAFEQAFTYLDFEKAHLAEREWSGRLYKHDGVQMTWDGWRKRAAYLAALPSPKVEVIQYEIIDQTGCLHITTDPVHAEKLRQALMSPVLADEGVGVKLLGWPPANKTGRLHSHGGLIGYTVVQSIGELPSVGMRQVWWWAGEAEAWKGPVESEDEAKAACQADYEARLHSALKATPPAVTP